VTARDAVVNRTEIPMKLTDTQLVLLSAAAQRQDGGVELAPTLKGGAAHRVVGKLLSEGLVEQTPAGGSLPVWRPRWVMRRARAPSASSRRVAPHDPEWQRERMVKGRKLRQDVEAPVCGALRLADLKSCAWPVPWLGRAFSGFPGSSGKLTFRPRCVCDN